MRNSLGEMPTITPNSLVDALQWRYATKQFDASKKIPSDTWDKIEHSLVLTPSSFGLQPWKFLIVENTDLRSQLLAHSWGQTQVTDASHFVVMAAPKTIDTATIDLLINTTAETRGIDASVLAGYREMMIGFLLQPNLTDADRLNWAAKQIYIALGQLMTSAALLGIDACPMEGFVPAEYDKILNLEAANLTSIVCCALGYRSADDKYAAAPKIRYNRESLVLHI